MPEASIARSRAPAVFLVRMEPSVPKNTVPDKRNDGSGLLLSRIADCVRTVSRPRKAETVFNKAARF